MDLVEIRTAEGLERSYPIMKELRESLSFEDFVSIYEQAKSRDEYRLVGAFEAGGQCVAVMGYRVLYDYVHGKHLYIDDLVVTEKKRSGGIGAELLRFAETKAKELKCRGLRLCTGIDRENSKRFYEKNDWKARAVAFKKIL